MSKKITDFTEIQLREIFSKAGLNSQEVDKAVADYIRYRESEISSLSILSYRDIKAIGGEALISLLENVQDSTDLVEEILKFLPCFYSFLLSINMTEIRKN